MLGCALPIRRPDHAGLRERRPLVDEGGQERREQVDLHPLAEPRGLAVAQGGEDPDRGEEPATTSTSATPTFCGSPSGSPVMLMSPPSACTSRS
jgi:hypothetical protein